MAVYVGQREYPPVRYGGPFRTPIFVLFHYYDHFEKRWWFELRQSKKAPFGRYESEADALVVADHLNLRVQRQSDGVFLREGIGEWQR